jgi:hypothetical protein
MGEREIIQDRIRKKEQEIQWLEEKIRAARIYVQALQDVLKVMDGAQKEGESGLKPGSNVAQARELILRRGAPVHINDLLTGLGKEVTRETRASLTGTIAAYVRRGEIFSRPAPNTFGLIELGHTTTVEEHLEPPPGFGR